MSYRDEIKELEDKATPIECINEIIECLESLYTESNGMRLPQELYKYGGAIKVAHSEALLLKKKLSLLNKSSVTGDSSLSYEPSGLFNREKQKSPSGLFDIPYHDENLTGLFTDGNCTKRD